MCEVSLLRGLFCSDFIKFGSHYIIARGIGTGSFGVFWSRLGVLLRNFNYLTFGSRGRVDFIRVLDGGDKATLFSSFFRGVFSRVAIGNFGARLRFRVGVHGVFSRLASFIPVGVVYLGVGNVCLFFFTRLFSGVGYFFIGLGGQT